MQNRVSAYRFRIKRKQEYETLKDYVNQINQENEQLKQEVSYTKFKSLLLPNQFD
jgi:cell division protein FtsB